MRIIRSVAAVAVGYGFMALPALLPLSSLVARVFVTGISAVLAGWLAARVGGRAPFTHAAALAALVATLSILAVQQGATGPQPAWYPAVIGVLGVGGVLAGGALRSAAAQSVS